MSTTPLSAETGPVVTGAETKTLKFADLNGWSSDNSLKAWDVFKAHCTAMLAQSVSLRQGLPPSATFLAICSNAVAFAPSTPAQARLFFEEHFQPIEITPTSGAGFLTGYYEPEVEGSPVPTVNFTAPLLAKPHDVETIPPGGTRAGIPDGFAAARREADGTFTVYPNRAAIQSGALGKLAAPLLWLRDDVEVFFLQVQGSGRVRLSDGTVRRIAYAGRNGHPYTTIGRIIVQEGHLPLERAQLEPLKAWLRANPVEGKRIMQMNNSYVFFRIADELPMDAGPIGGAGLPLTPLRSIAIDRTQWSYGLPIWLEAQLPHTAEPFRQLTIAEDTGSAIVGPARADLYLGSGAQAGIQAGAVRHPMRFVVLWPKRPS